MWNPKKLLLLLIVVSLFIDCCQCKKRKTKRKKNQEEDSNTYSPYFENEDFKASAVDAPGSFQGMGPETTTMGLYGPAFPTAEDTTPYSAFAGQVSGFSPYLSNMASSDQEKAFQLFNDYRAKPAYEDVNAANQDHSSQQDYDAFDQQPGDSTPVYGTKLSAKDTIKKPSLYGDSLNYQSIYSYASTWPTTNIDNLNDLKLSSSSYKTNFKKGPPPSDFTSFKGNFHTDFSENAYAYPTPATKDSYQSVKDAFSTSSKDAYQNTKDPFSTNPKDSYQLMKDAFSTSSKDAYDNVKNGFSNSHKDSYQSMKDAFSTSSKDAYKNIEDPFSTNPKDSYQSMKDAFSTSSKDAYDNMKNAFSNSLKDSYQSMKDEFSTSSKDAYKNIEDSFSTSPKDSYESIRDVFSTSSKDAYRNMKDAFLTSSNDDYQNMKDPFSNSPKDSYQKIKNPFSTKSKETYQTIKDPFSTKYPYHQKDQYLNNQKDLYPTMDDEISTSSKGIYQIKDTFHIDSKDPYQGTKNPVSIYENYYKSKDTFPTSNQNVKNEFSSTSFTLEHDAAGSVDHEDTLDFTDQDKYKPTVNILPNSYKNYKNSLNYSDPKYDFKNTDLYSSYKDQFNTKPKEPYSTINSLNYNDWKGTVKTNEHHFKDSSKHKDDSSIKSPYSLPEYVGSQSSIKNVIDFTGENNPFKDSIHDSDFTNFKDPRFKDVVDFTNIKNPYSNTDYSNSYSNIDNSAFNSWKPPKNKFPSDETLTKHFGMEFVNPTNSPFADSSVPTLTSHWGNMFKDYDSYKSKKPQMDADDESVLHIPKKTKPSSTFGKFGSGKTIEEWNKEVSERFKSEEELLGLRNHDTSHPSYIPTYKLKEELSDLNKYASNFDYGSIAEKWKYLNSQLQKPKAMDVHSEAQQGHKSVHVPYPKPYPVEIPHPVIVPVPQPYPVRVPVPRPVAVPVVHEIKVPVERPVPYPVIKKVPYPVDKPFPVPIEKPVPVPVMKPYPVPIPHVRPVFHHSRPRPHRDENEFLSDPDSEQFLHETRIRGHAERIPVRPVKNRRAKVRPRRRRPPAQSRGQRGSRRPPGRQSYGNYRRTTAPRQFKIPKTGQRLHRPGSKFKKPVHSEKHISLLNENKQNSAEGDQYIDMRLSRYASEFKDLTLEEPSDGHDHNDYFKYCQNNPLCYISRLKMPVLE